MSELADRSELRYEMIASINDVSEASDRVFCKYLGSDFPISAITPETQLSKYIKTSMNLVMNLLKAQPKKRWHRKQRCYSVFLSKNMK